MADPVASGTVVPINPTIPSAMKETTTPEADQIGSASERADNTAGATSSPPVPDVRLQVAISPQPAPSALSTRQPSKLEEIQKGQIDCNGNTTQTIYARQPGAYAIYQANNEVIIHFSDDIKQEQDQRKAIMPLSSARADVHWLVQGLRCREVYDRQMAYALQLALEGDAEGAKLTIAKVKDDLLTKRAARGRFQYLQWSLGTSAILLGLLFVPTRFHVFSDPDLNCIWVAAKAGVIGAAFSIALAIRGRTVALDTDRLANVTDGTLRLVIGIISAGLLLLLLHSGVVPNLTVGGFNLAAPTLNLQMVLLVGFVGGFLERLVPDLLEKRNLPGNGPLAGAPARAN
jgi:hypothetical protein